MTDLDEFNEEDIIDAIFAMANAWATMQKDADTYQDRVVDRYETDKLLVSTALVNDSRLPYETAIGHPAYGSALVIVQTYDSPEDAQVGHDHWVHIMTQDKLPDYLTDVSESDITDARDKLSGKSWRIKRKSTSMEN